MDKELCCYLVTKDVLSQEYPFLEAIYSMLPICNKMIILDGYSKDGSFEILKTISSKNKKISLYQAEWIGKTFGEKILYASKLARKKCNGQYIFQFQANEIIHKDNTNLLESLPEIFPKYQTFSLPYMQFLREIPFTGEHRVRLHKNLEFIGPVGDAWTSGIEKKDLKNLILKDVFRSPKNIVFNAFIVLLFNLSLSIFSLSIITSCVFLLSLVILNEFLILFLFVSIILSSINFIISI